MNTMQQIVREKAPTSQVAFRSGDTVRVHVRIKEGDKERLQVFEGVVIRLSRANNSFTVRKVSYGVGVERVFPFDSPAVDHVDVASRGSVRQSRLYYLRDLKGKKARIQQRSREEFALGGMADESAEEETASPAGAAESSKSSAADA